MKKQAFIPAVAAFFAAFACMQPTAYAEDVKITLNGTVSNVASGAGMGFTLGQPVTFYWIVNDYSPATPVGSAGVNTLRWLQETDTEPRLWESVGGTGIDGTFSVGTGGTPYELVSLTQVGGYSGMLAAMRTDDFNTSPGNNHGIYLAADPSFLVSRLLFDFRVDPIPWAMGVGVPNPATYLAGYVGTYNINDPAITGVLEANNGSVSRSINFTGSTMTIESVPEPSTYALLALGAAGLGAHVLRRRRK